MSEKQQEPETCTVINDTPQSSAATWFVVRSFTNTLLHIYCWVCLERIFKISVSGEVMGKKSRLLL